MSVLTISVEEIHKSKSDFQGQLRVNTATKTGINLGIMRKLIRTSFKQFASKNSSKDCSVGYHEVTKLGVISSPVNLSFP